MRAINSPIETGVRSLIVLTSVFPGALDLSRLVLMDYCLLHSGDLGGPRSVLPAVPARNGEMGVKRSIVEHGTQVMVRARMVDVLATSAGISYRASEGAMPFLQLLKSPHVAALTTVSHWVAEELGDLDEVQIRQRMRSVVMQWSEEFEWRQRPGREGWREGNL